MKKILVYFLFASTFMVMSCSDDLEIFDKPSTERVSEQISEYNKVLLSADNGWKMAYFPDASRLGGYNFLFDFKEDGRVTMRGDVSTSNFEQGEHESSYSFNDGQGVVLSFDTYNALHILADPGFVPAGTGYRGDFELVVERVSEDSVICHGRKWNQPMILTRASADDWTDGVEEIENNELALAPAQANVPFFRNLSVDGKALGTFLYDLLSRYIEYYYVDDETGETKSGSCGVAFTREGFSLQRPIVINGVTLKDFKHDASTGGFVFGSNGAITMEDESIVEFEDAWDDLYQYTGASLYRASKDFNTLFNDADAFEPDLTTLQFYWNINGYRQISLILSDDQGDTNSDNDSIRLYHSLMSDINSPGEDNVFFTAAINADTQQRIMGKSGNVSDASLTEELNRLFFADTPESDSFNAILDLFYEVGGFSVIPMSDGRFYLISKTHSNYWVILTPFD
ncbi:MAG: DUF4302 domain-containing protein [Bacteroidales bacterium]